MILKVVILVIILAAGLTGFLMLDVTKGILWLIFCIAAYPMVLSFTVGKQMGSDDLITMYKAGLSQIPVLGQLFYPHIPSKRKPDDDTPI
jgi:uncharacterized SAM-binding protein YcdF (DUF218 family)